MLVSIRYLFMCLSEALLLLSFKIEIDIRYLGNDCYAIMNVYILPKFIDSHVEI